MKKTAIALVLLLTASAQANMLLNPAFDLGPDGLDFWEGYDVPSATVLDPAIFVSVAGGTASVSGYSVGETAFYQTFLVGGLASGTYQFTADASNIADPAAFIFVKVFTGGNFGAFDGAKFQHPLLIGGTNTIVYTHDAGDLVQFGFSGFSATEGFDVANLSLVAVPEPSALSLLGVAVAAIAIRRRRHDLP